MQQLTFETYEKTIVETGIYHASIQKYVESLNIPSEVDQQRLHKLLSSLYVTLGLIGEAGEIAEKMKKIIRDRSCEITKEDTLLLQKETGDVVWYAAANARELGTSLANVAQQNIDKLQSRKQRGVISGSGDNR